MSRAAGVQREEGAVVREGLVQSQRQAPGEGEGEEGEEAAAGEGEEGEEGGA